MWLPKGQGRGRETRRWRLTFIYNEYITRLYLLDTHCESESCSVVSNFQLFATPWTIQSVEFSRPEYWCGQPFLSPGDLPKPGIEPGSPALQADSLPTELSGKPRYTLLNIKRIINKDLLFSPANSAQYSAIYRKRIWKKIYVYIELTQFVVCLKLTQHCKSNILKHKKRQRKKSQKK